jgi:hypothetical protein
MNTNVVVKRAGLRLLLLTVLSLVFVWGLSEIAFQFQKTDRDRPPQAIELVIPAGTSAKVAAGDPADAIPSEMSFVIGDTLVVKNEDTTDHVMGPLWIPAGASASLKLEQPNKFAYSCSFTPSRYFGVDVEQPTTWRTRFTAFSLAVPVTVGFLFIYSLILWPIDNKPKESTANPNEETPTTNVVG